MSILKACLLPIDGCQPLPVCAGFVEQTASLLHRFAFLDIETTGLDFERDEIIEVAVVFVEHGASIGEKSWLVRPSRSIPPFITTLTNLTDADVEHAPSFAEIRDDFRAAITGWTLVAHNASFERGFLGALIEDLPMLDSCELSHLLFPELPSHSLDSLIRWTGVGRGARHRALADAEDTFAVVSQLLARAKARLRLADIDARVQCLGSPAGTPLQALGDLLESLAKVLANCSVNHLDAEPPTPRSMGHELPALRSIAMDGIGNGVDIYESDEVNSAWWGAERLAATTTRVIVAVPPKLVGDFTDRLYSYRPICPTQHQRLLAQSHRTDALRMAHAYTLAAIHRCGSIHAVPINSWFAARYDLVRALVHVLTDCTCSDVCCPSESQWARNVIDSALHPAIVTHDLAHVLIQQQHPMSLVVVGLSDFQKAGLRRHSIRLDVASFEALAELIDQIEPHCQIARVVRGVAAHIESALGDGELQVDVPFESADANHLAVHRLMVALRHCSFEFEAAVRSTHTSSFFVGSLKAWISVLGEFCRAAPPAMMTMLRAEKTGLCLLREPEHSDVTHASTCIEGMGETKARQHPFWEVSQGVATQ